MYVIRVSNATGNTHTIAGVEILNNDHAYFPADRCVWKYAGQDPQNPEGYSNGQYDLNRVFFFPGNATDGTSLNNDGTASGTLTTTLGVIGKTGRFVGLTA